MRPACDPALVSSAALVISQRPPAFVGSLAETRSHLVLALQIQLVSVKEIQQAKAFWSAQSMLQVRETRLATESLLLELTATGSRWERQPRTPTVQELASIPWPD